MIQGLVRAAYAHAGALRWTTVAVSTLLSPSACSLAYPLDGYENPHGDGGPTNASDAGDAASLDAAAVVGTVRCGAAICKTPDEVCCGVPGAFSCTNASSCRQTSIACDDGADCAVGAVCCAFKDAGALTGVRCAAIAACPVEAGATVFCDPADPAACATGSTCKIASEAELPRTSTYNECR